MKSSDLKVSHLKKLEKFRKFLKKPKINQLASKLKRRLHLASLKVILGYERFTIKQVEYLIDNTDPHLLIKDKEWHSRILKATPSQTVEIPFSGPVNLETITSSASKPYFPNNDPIPTDFAATGPYDFFNLESNSQFDLDGLFSSPVSTDGTENFLFSDLDLSGLEPLVIPPTTYVDNSAASAIESDQIAPTPDFLSPVFNIEDLPVFDQFTLPYACANESLDAITAPISDTFVDGVGPGFQRKPRGLKPLAITTAPSFLNCVGSSGMTCYNPYTGELTPVDDSTMPNFSYQFSAISSSGSNSTSSFPSPLSVALPSPITPTFGCGLLGCGGYRCVCDPINQLKEGSDLRLMLTGQCVWSDMEKQAANYLMYQGIGNAWVYPPQF
ncbi:hypothetical protein HK098_001933 [Nowakowskiella sp. JEL0407]|nr:hypothetical protein HK098_001933 [Nowakowskiella sp. JEL0407]